MATPCSVFPVAATASIARAQAPAPRFKVLVIAERRDPKNADKHEIHRPYVEAAKTWLATLAADSNFTVSYLESPNTITDSTLSKVDVIWQMNYTPFRWNAAAKAALERYVDSGKGGWLGGHHASLYCAAVTDETWPWFFDNLIRGINYKNYVSRFASGIVRVEDAAHPVLEGVPANFHLHRGVVHLGQRPPRACARARERRRKHLRVRHGPSSAASGEQCRRQNGGRGEERKRGITSGHDAILLRWRPPGLSRRRRRSDVLRRVHEPARPTRVPTALRERITNASRLPNPEHAIARVSRKATASPRGHEHTPCGRLRLAARTGGPGIITLAPNARGRWRHPARAPR